MRIRAVEDPPSPRAGCAECASERSRYAAYPACASFSIVVPQAEELPRRIDRGPAAQREALEPLVVAQVAEHGLHRREALPVLRTPPRRIDPRAPQRGMRDGVGIGSPPKERDVAHGRRVRRAETLGAKRLL